MKRTIEELDEKVAFLLETNAQTAALALKSYEESCKTCRSVYDHYVRKTVGTFNPFECGFLVKDTKVYCPACSRCVYDRD